MTIDLNTLQRENFLLRNALDRVAFLLLTEDIDPALLTKVRDLIAEYNFN